MVSVRLGFWTTSKPSRVFTASQVFFLPFIHPQLTRAIDYWTGIPQTQSLCRMDSAYAPAFTVSHSEKKCRASPVVK